MKPFYCTYFRKLAKIFNPVTPTHIFAGLGRVLLLCFLTFSAADAGAEELNILNTRDKAQSVIKRAVEAYGGEEFLKGINNVRYTQEGVRTSDLEGSSPNDLFRELPYSKKIVLQLDEGRVYSEHDLKDAGYAPSLNGSNSSYVFLISDEAFYLMFPKVKLSTTGFTLPGVIEAAARNVPQLIVRDLSDDLSKLEWIGVREEGGKNFDLVSFPENDIIYLFDQQTGLLEGFENISRNPAKGEAIRTTRFEGYTEVDGVVVPERTFSKRGDQLLFRYTYLTFELDATIDEAVFTPPEDFTVYENIMPFEPARVDKIADHVYLLYGPLHTLVVEFEDYVVVVATHSRAPENLEMIRELTGNKPIQVAVSTHHHWLHNTGLAAFADQGIPIMTTPQNQSYLEDMVRVSRGEGQSPGAKDPIFDLINDKKVYEDGATRLEIMKIGPIGHVDELLIAWLPEERVVFTSDMLATNPHALPLVIGDYYRQQAIDNFNAILDAGIEPKIFLSEHSKQATFEEMRAAIYGEKGN